MARLIYADELRNEMHGYVFPITTNNLMGAADVYYRILHLLDDMPTVDAVEVVRCEDCKHRFAFCCHKHRMYVDRDDFCSWGAKMDGGDKE